METSAEEESGRVLEEGVIRKVKRSKLKGLTLYISNDRNTAVLGQAGCSPDPSTIAAATVSEGESVEQKITAKNVLGNIEKRRIIDEIVNVAATTSSGTLGAIKRHGGFQRVSWPDH